MYVTQVHLILVFKVGRWQARRQLADFSSKAEQVLWFADSFGVELDTLHGHTASGEKVVVKLSDTASASTPETRVSDEDRDKVLLVLYLLDKFGVGDAFYHELSMINRSLPRSHKVKQAQVEYNSEIQLKTIPHYDGMYRSFEDTLKEHIHKLV